MPKILIIQGSLNPNSKTAIVAKAAEKILQGLENVDCETLDLRSLDMQFCDGRKLQDYNSDAQKAYKMVDGVDGMIIGMPVYCYSVSGPLKNFIDIIASAMENKPAGILCTAGSSMSYLASSDLAKILAYESHVLSVQPVVCSSYEDFKDGKIDLLFVYNMLLTGFDSSRLKKLYIGRVIKSHNLLQALTRVNRTYEEFNYGYVVDFANIEKEFEKTNQNYFKELQGELGDEFEHYSNLFKTKDEIEHEIEEIKNVLFHFDTVNAENFSQQITQINSRSEMLKISHALNNAKDLYNIIRLSGNYEMLEKLDFQMLTVLSREANNRLALINTKEALENNVDTNNLLNIALEDVYFAFTKVKEEEMILADELKSTLQKTREGLGGNFDQKDPVFISLKEELERLFKKKNLDEVTKEQMELKVRETYKLYDEQRKALAISEDDIKELEEISKLIDK